MLDSVSNVPCYLIIDDSPLSLKWLAQILQSIAPCKIIDATDGVEAMDKLASDGEDIDAIISDLRMPRMNGLELLKQVRLAETGARQSIPFFIVTGFAERELAGLALGLDVDAFLARPVKKQALSRHLIRTSTARRADKSPSEARAAYAEVDLTSTMAPGQSFAKEPPAAQIEESTFDPGLVAVLDERLVALETVNDGTPLARDAVNSAGTVLLKAGEEITAGLKAVLMSYAEIDESLAKVWVRAPAH